MTNLRNTNISSLLYPGIDLTGCRLGVGSSRGEVPPEPTPVMSQGWSVLGKTNEDADRATIKNIAGNGNDLVLSNFAFTQESGYNDEGYLVTNGVDDKVISSFFNLGKDWTMVGEWFFIEKKYSLSGLAKASSFFLYNLSTEMRIYINSGTIINNLAEVRQLKAVCSDGRVYDKDWKEYVLTAGTTSSSSSNLKIGVSSDESKFTSLAFKNLAIYDQILDKGQCISEYNKLQTLKPQ